MEITYELDLLFHEDLEDDEATPTAEDIACWVCQGIYANCFPAADVVVSTAGSTPVRLGPMPNGR